MNWKKLLELSKKNIKLELIKARNLHELTVCKNLISGKGSEIAKFFMDAPIEEKKIIGKDWKEFKNMVEKEFNFFKKQIIIAGTDPISSIDSEEFKKTFSVDENSLISYTYEGSIMQKTSGTPHPLSLIIYEIHEFFQKLNFTFYESKELDETKYIFDYLNIPVEHPSRSEKDNFYINDEFLLRPHSTNMTAHFLRKIGGQKIDDFYGYTIGNVYRDDTDDASHLQQFMQIDIFLGGEDLSLANLKWIVKEFIYFLLGSETKIQFRLNQFPFTEPSFEVDISMINDENGNENWIEILGAGIIRPEVLKKCDVTTTKTVLAFGAGIERLAMIKYKLNDVRDFYNSDFKIK